MTRSELERAERSGGKVKDGGDYDSDQVVSWGHDRKGNEGGGLGVPVEAGEEGIGEKKQGGDRSRYMHRRSNGVMENVRSMNKPGRLSREGYWREALVVVEMTGEDPPSGKDRGDEVASGRRKKTMGIRGGC